MQFTFAKKKEEIDAFLSYFDANYKRLEMRQESELRLATAPNDGVDAKRRSKKPYVIRERTE